MRVLFLITVLTEGAGGHVHTMLSNLDELKRAGFQVDLVIIGKADPPACRNQVHEFISCNGLNMISVCRRLNQYRGYDVYHAFDEFAFFFARFLSLRKNSRVLYTRCGGANPVGRYYPSARVLVCLSRENFAFFSARAKPGNHVMLLPGRVPSFQMDSQLQRSLLRDAACVPGELVILRIARITKYYEKSILQAAELGKALRARGQRAKTIVVGKVYDDALAARLERCHPDVAFVHDEKYTTDARRLLGCADLVVGTGRSFMEAAMVGKIVLAPNEGGRLPVLATSRTIDALFDMNFSERSRVDVDEEQALGELIALLEDAKARERYVAWVRAYASAHFSAEHLGKLLPQVYEKCLSGRYAYWDLLRHGIRTFSVFLRYVGIRQR